MRLAICKRIVERNHGSIEAYGEEGEGAKFVNRLPYSPDGMETVDALTVSHTVQ
jgi:signal transduction histidine kinase